MAKKSKKNTNKLSDLSMQLFAVSSSAFIGTETVELTAGRMSRSEKKQIKQVRLISGIGMIVSGAGMVIGNAIAPMPITGDYSDMD